MPAIDSISQGGRLEQAQGLSLNFHSHPCMAVAGATVKAYSLHGTTRNGATGELSPGF
jgi:hypothetical protein